MLDRLLSCLIIAAGSMIFGMSIGDNRPVQIALGLVIMICAITKFLVLPTRWPRTKMPRGKVTCL